MGKRQESQKLSRTMENRYNLMINTYLNGNLGEFKVRYDKFNVFEKDYFILWLYNTALSPYHLLSMESVLKMYKFLLRDSI